MNIQEPPVAASVPVRKKRRWWIYALIGLGGIVLLGILAVVLLFGYARSLVRNYTASSPVPIAKAQPDPQRLKELGERWNEFAKAIKSRQNPPPFAITADDINLVLAQNKGVRDNVHFVITNDQLLAEFSAPLDQIGPKQLKGRYLNGVAKINVALPDGWLNVNVASAQANGQPVPGWLLKRVQRENLLRELEKNNELVNLFHELENIQITNGQIILNPLGQ